MNNEIKFNYIKRLWHLQDGVIYTRWGNKPVAFAGKDKSGHRYTTVKISGKNHAIHIHEAIFVLFHDRPITKGKELHHKDGNPENNAVDNLVELTDKQHRRIHQYQTDNSMRGIRLYQGAWQFRWLDDDGRLRSRSFRTIDEAKALRDEIEEPRRQELRALGLNCKKEYRGVTASQLRKISRQQNTRLWRAHI